MSESRSGQSRHPRMPSECPSRWRRGAGVCEETLWISGRSAVVSDCGENTAETAQEI